MVDTDNGRRYHVMLKADRPDCSDVYLTGYSMPHPEAVTFMSKVSTPRPAGQRLMLEEIPKGFRWTPEQAIIPVREAALGNAGIPLEMNRLPSRAQVLAYLAAAGFTPEGEGRDYRSLEGLLVTMWPEFCTVPPWPESFERSEERKRLSMLGALSVLAPEIVSTIQDITLAAAMSGSAIWNCDRVAGVLCQVEVKA